MPGIIRRRVGEVVGFDLLDLGILDTQHNSAEATRGQPLAVIAHDRLEPEGFHLQAMLTRDLAIFHLDPERQHWRNKRSHIQTPDVQPVGSREHALDCIGSEKERFLLYSKRHGRHLVNDYFLLSSRRFKKAMEGSLVPVLRAAS